LNASDSLVELSKKERLSLQKLYHRELVKRSTFTRIILAWIVTIPGAALLASLIFLLID
jgi:PiT family inorganic phosphate transporter